MMMLVTVVVLVLVILFEESDIGGVMLKDCKGTEQKRKRNNGIRCAGKTDGHCQERLNYTRRK